MDTAEPFLLRLAGITVRVVCQFPESQDYCRDYLCGERCGRSGGHTGSLYMEVQVGKEQLNAERAASPAYPDTYLERLSIYRQIAEGLPAFGRAVFHGAVVQFQGKAYFFSAPSGTGKSTHVALWKRYMGEQVGIINGDKPILGDDGNQILAYGTPWAGKEGWQSNVCAPLQGGCFLRQAKRNQMVRLRPEECAEWLLGQLYLPSHSQAAVQTLELADQIIKRVPMWILECDMSEEAVRLSFETMTGLAYSMYHTGGEGHENEKGICTS